MEELNGETVGRWARSRALSTPTAAIVMIVVILVVGGIGYVGLNATKSTPVTQVSCAPASSPACANTLPTHDLGLQVPFKSVQEGNVVPFTATLPSGETATSYTFDFGDGTTSPAAATASASHIYSAPGTYIASVTATVNGVTHDNYRALDIITVSSSFSSSIAGDLPRVTGTIVSNGSAGPSPTAILQPGGTATFEGTYSSAPTNPLFTLSAPWIMGPSGLTPTSNVSTNSSATTGFSFPTTGTFVVSFIGTSTSGSTVAHQYYNWSVFVAPSGFNAGTVGSAASTSPHKGFLNVYELAPGGSNSEDPAVDYETVGYEPIINVYQTLIAYNGSDTGPSYQSYVPVIATCVPGSVTGANSCASMYSGDSLVDATGTNYTFAISSAPQFYDSVTGAHWGVWPTDVVFSLARTMGFSTTPCDGCNNGWIITQSLLSGGNATWDGLHGPLNNTPGNILGSMTINGTDCPAVAMENGAHGCVTFDAAGGGKFWPYFLELIADGLGSSIVPCGWFSAASQGAGIPYWTQGNITGAGDHPCQAPGQGLGVAPSAMPATGWDNWELAGGNPPFLGNVQFHMAGSGPYYLSDLRPAASYSLAANPAYASNPECTWTGCFPSPHQYAGNVSVTWETSQVPGEQAYAAGAADFASIPSTDTAFLLQLLGEGKVAATSFPSISIYFFPFNLNFNYSAVLKYTSNPINVPSDFFSYVGVRQLFAHSYPYATVESTIATKDGIQYLFNYGGAIPQFMANYYPTNVSWPTGDPVTTSSVVGSAGYWWAQLQNPTSPYYDSEVAGCSASSPCQLPFFGETGSPALDQQTALWASEISAVTGGAMKLDVIDINFVDLVINSLYLGAYNDPMPVYTLGWAPDYPDPTDYMVPLYQADSSYTLGDVDLEQMTLSQFNASSCTATYSINDYTYWSNLASTSGIPNDCQGAAYLAMQVAMQAASVMPAGPARVLAYAEIEQIANALALYTYWGQQNQVVSTAPWISPTSFNSNVTIGGGSDSTWYTIQGNGIY